MPEKNIPCQDGHVSDHTWWETDFQGIMLCKVCDHCVEHKLSKYRPEILSGYDQNDVDEPIEPIDGSWWLQRMFG
jgi:hypothetical protein